MKKTLLHFRLTLSLVFTLIFTVLFSAHSQDQASTEGKEFWVGFLPMGIVDGTPRILISSRLGANVTVSMAQNMAFAPITVNVPANGTRLINTITLAQAGTGNFNSETISNQSYLVKSNDNDISVVASNERATFTEASIILPKTALGSVTEYVIVNPITTVTVQPQSFAVFKIVAIEDNTTLTINLKANSSGGKLANTPFNVTLQRGQTVQYRVQNAGQDFSGSTVKSDGSCKPFAVFAGQTQGTASCPINVDSYQHLYEQMYPLATWGKEYIATPLLGTNTLEQTNGYFVRITAANDNTTVTLKNGTTTQVLTLNALQSQVIDIVPPIVNILDALHIEADKPISVLELSKATGCNGANWGNPAVVSLNPLNQQTGQTVFNTVPTGGAATAYHHINVVMKTADVADLRYNNLTTAPSGATLISLAKLVKDKPEYSYIRIPIGITNSATAMFNVQVSALNNKSFTAFAYGAIDQFASYMYSVGATFQNLLYNFTATPQQICGANRTINFAGFGNNALGFSWDFGDGSPLGTGATTSHTYTSTGTFTVKMIAQVAAGTGCGNTNSFDIIKEVKIYNIPTPNLGTNKTVCVGAALALSVPNDTEQTVEWYKDNVRLTTTGLTLNINTSTPTNSGSYKVKIIKSGFCEGESPAVQITIVPPPAMVSLSPATLDICATVNPTLTATTGFTYKWVRNNTDTLAGAGTWLGTTNNTFVPILLGNYTCVILNANGCRTVTNVAVVTGTVANVVIKGENDKTVFCEDKTLKLLGTVTPANPAFTYQWQTKTGMIYTDILGATNLDYITNNSGTFRLKINLSGNCTSFSNDLVIEKRAKPLAVANLSQLIVCQGDNVNFSTISAPTGSDYEYSWYQDGVPFNSLQNFVYTATTAGTLYFYVKINDKNVAESCETQSAFVTLTVTTAPEPIIATVGTNNFCQGQSRTLQTVITPTSQVWLYQWFKDGIAIAGETNSNLLVSGNATTGSGSYTVKITTPPNCTRTTTTPFVVEVYPLPTITITNLNTDYCDNSPSFTPVGLPSGGFFKLNGIAIQPPYSPTQLGAGTYNLRYTSQSVNGCKDSIDRVFTIKPSTVVDITTAIPTVICTQTTPFALNATPLGGSFSINGGADIANNAANSVIFNPATVGVNANVQIIYSFTAANGCVSRDTLQTQIIAAPGAPTLADISTCKSVGSVRLNAYVSSHDTNIGYEWTNIASPAILSTAATLIVTVSGTYQIKITDIRACNPTIKQVKVDFNANPTVDLGANRTVCGTIPTILDADIANANNANFKYLWNTGATSKTIRIQSDTIRGLRTYWVKVTDENFPSKCVTLDTILLFFNDLPVVNLGKDVTVCSPKDVPYTLIGLDISHASQGVTYKWFNPASPATILATTSNYNITTAGIYSLMVTNNKGCSKSDTIKVDFNSNPAIKLTGFDNGIGVCQLRDTLYVEVANPANFDITWTSAVSGGIVSTSADKLSIIVDKSGRYSVKVADKTQPSKCDAILFADVFIADFPSAKILPTNATKKIVICQDSVITFNANDISHLGSFKYEWRKVGNDAIIATTSQLIINYSLSGNYNENRYTVRVIPPSGCVSNDTISLQFLEKAVAKVTDNYPKQICLGETLTFEASGGTSYKWTSNEPDAGTIPNTATVKIKPKSAGTFTYTVEVGTANSLCKATKIAIKIVVNPELLAKISKQDAKKEIRICEDASIELDGFQPVHPLSVRYTWKNITLNAINSVLGNNSKQTINFSTLQPKVILNGYETQFIELSVNDLLTGCTSRDTIKFIFERKAKPIIKAPKEICVGDTLVLSVNDGEFHKWNQARFADTTIKILGDVNAATLKIIHKEAGLKTYWVASRFNNSCSEGKDTTRIIVNPLPIAVAHSNKNMKVCAGDNVTLRASGGVRYEWKHGATGAEIVVSPTTDSCFVVSVFNASGCKSMDTVCIKVTPIRKLPPRLFLCEPETTVLDATNPDPAKASYSWNNGYDTPKIPITKGGIYTVTVKILGCEYQQSCEVIYKNTPKIALKTDTLLCFARTGENEDAPYRTATHLVTAKLLNREAGEVYLYEWRIKGSTKPIDGGVGIVGNDNLIPLTIGRLDTTYILRIQSKSANCATEAAIKVVVNCTGRIKIPTAFTPNGDKLNDTFAPITSDLTGILVQVYQKWGDIIFEKYIDPKNNGGWDGIFKEEDGWDGTFGGSDVVSDTYQYVITYWSKNKVGGNVRASVTGSLVILRKIE